MCRPFGHLPWCPDDYCNTPARICRTNVRAGPAWLPRGRREGARDGAAWLPRGRREGARAGPDGRRDVRPTAQDQGRSGSRNSIMWRATTSGASIAIMCATPGMTTWRAFVRSTSRSPQARESEKSSPPDRARIGAPTIESRASAGGSRRIGCPKTRAGSLLARTVPAIEFADPDRGAPRGLPGSVDPDRDVERDHRVRVGRIGDSRRYSSSNSAFSASVSRRFPAGDVGGHRDGGHATVGVLERGVERDDRPDGVARRTRPGRCRARRAPPPGRRGC